MAALSRITFFGYELGWTVASWWPGVILVMLGSICINVGTNVMKIAINKRLELPPEARKRLTKTPVWLAGLLGYIFGTLLSFASFKFAAQSLLAGLSSVQFLSQVFFSKFFLKETVDRFAFLGVAMICGGCVLIVIFGTHETRNYEPVEIAALFGRSPYVCYMLSIAALSMFASVLYSQQKQRITRARGAERWSTGLATMPEKQLLGLLYSFRSAVWGTQAVILAKALSMLITQLLSPREDQDNPLQSYETYFFIVGLIAAGTFWVMRLNHSLRLFDAVYIIPMMQIMWMLFSSLSGGVFYDEFSGWGVKECTCYIIGFGTILAGVVFLCPRAPEERPITSADVMNELGWIEPMRPPNAAQYEAVALNGSKHVGVDMSDGGTDQDADRYDADASGRVGFLPAADEDRDARR
eukprot:Plantae.Rhodophyta-Rhodochaete_pulchella.ctg7345.p1 GENE.Plantae.Rhodophyta-Rhodochaete_pulchella.ctg7345~~Plantae.Rhodophyta-Rhodochaete_pulchella.ctg7345.p1  ORF type:complete len:433 (+),score=55.32 Plantae.Rhodophyta-Rhodochaete_pulchella.ctg7345:69-1301(+)